MRAARLTLLCILGSASLVLNSNAFAASRSVAVFESGRTVIGGQAKGGFACGEGDLAFVFSESVNNQQPPIVLNVPENEEGEAEAIVTVTITQACGEGEVSFSYRHDSANGNIGEGGDLAIDPLQFSISLPATTGATQSTAVQYQAIDDSESEEDEIFTLFGSSIVFFIGNTTGQTMDRRDLARIIIPANSDQAVDPGNVPEGGFQNRQTINSFNNACSNAQPGSELALLCEQVSKELSVDEDDPIDEDIANQLIKALDPRETTQVINIALTNIGRIQHSNILNRLNVLRHGGGGGFDFEGIELAMNGQSFNTGWIQNYLNAEEEEESTGGGGGRLLSQKWGMFLTGSVSVGDQEIQGAPLTSDFDVYDITGGADYRFDNGLVLGAAVGFTRFESEVTANGTLDSDSLTVQAFGTYNITDRFYMDATAAYAQGDVDQNRVVDLSGIGNLGQQFASGSTETSQFAASLAANYRAFARKGWSLTTYGSLYFADSEIDALEEEGTPLALAFQARSSDVLLSTLGLRGTKVFNLGNGVLTAFTDLAYKHESNDPVQVDTTFVATDTAGPTVFLDDPDTQFGTFAIGASWVFPSGNQMFASFETLLLDDVRTRHTLFIGGRYEF